MQARVWLMVVVGCVFPLTGVEAAARRGGKGQSNGASSALLMRQMQMMQMKKQQFRKAASDPRLHQQIMLGRQRELALKQAHERQHNATAMHTETDPKASKTPASGAVSGTETLSKQSKPAGQSSNGNPATPEKK